MKYILIIITILIAYETLIEKFLTLIHNTPGLI